MPNASDGQAADRACAAYLANMSEDNLLAWFRAELACNAAALRQHGHHDEDVLRKYSTRVPALTRSLYEERTGGPVVRLVKVA